MAKITLERALKLSLITGILIASLSVFYYFVIYKPILDRQAFDEKRFELLSRVEVQKKKNEAEEQRIAKEKQIRKQCYVEAEKVAKELMKEKAAMFPEDAELQKALDGDLYFKFDFENAYKNCLRRNGLEE